MNECFSHFTSAIKSIGSYKYMMCIRVLRYHIKSITQRIIFKPKLIMGFTYGKRKNGKKYEILNGRGYLPNTSLDTTHISKVNEFY